jgi:hypothetical protein
VNGAALSLPEKVVAIDKGLNEARIRHAFGGALALAYYAEPRATIDIDLNVFAPTGLWDKVGEALSSLGVETVDLDRLGLERDGQCRVWWGRTPLDLFFSYDPIHEEMRKEARKVPFADTTIPILGPEHLAVCKAMFDRPKDWLDIEQMFIAADDFDASEVERWLRKMVGEDDRRLEQLKELRARLPNGDY